MAVTARTAPRNVFVWYRTVVWSTTSRCTSLRRTWSWCSKRQCRSLVPAVHWPFQSSDMSDSPCPAVHSHSQPPTPTPHNRLLVYELCRQLVVTPGSSRWNLGQLSPPDRRGMDSLFQKYWYIIIFLHVLHFIVILVFQIFMFIVSFFVTCICILFVLNVYDYFVFYFFNKF